MKGGREGGTESGDRGGVRAQESNTRREGMEGWDRDSDIADKHR
jgi:hypothetical protein